MPTEEQELRLKVVLDDQASAGVARLKSSIMDLTSGQAAASMEKFKRSQVEIGEKVKQLTELLGGGERAMLGFIGKMGGMGLGLAGLGALLTETALKMSNLSDKAKLSGIEPARLKNFVDQLERAGVASDVATESATRFAGALADLSRFESQRYQTLLNMAGTHKAEMIAGIREVERAATLEDKFNKARELAGNVQKYRYAEDIRRGKDATVASADAAKAANEFFKTLTDMDPITYRLGDNIHRMTEEQRRNAQAALDNGVKVKRAFDELTKSAESVGEALLKAFGGPISEALKSDARDIEAIVKGLDAIEAWWKRFTTGQPTSKSGVKPPWNFGDWMFGGGKATEGGPTEEQRQQGLEKLKQGMQAPPAPQPPNGSSVGPGTGKAVVPDGSVPVPATSGGPAVQGRSSTPPPVGAPAPAAPAPAAPAPAAPIVGGRVTGSGAAAGKGFSSSVKSAIGQAAGSSGLSEGMLTAIASVESGGKPGERTGSYKGLFQLSEKEFHDYGGKGSIYDPAENARVAALKIKAETAQLSKKLGRPATDAEAYLAHQQGVGGATEHLTHPDRPAWESMYATAEGQQKGAAWAKRAVWGNIPDPMKPQFGKVENVTSGQFTTLWRQRYARAIGDKGTGTAQAVTQPPPQGGAPPAATAQTTAQQPAPGGGVDPNQAGHPYYLKGMVTLGGEQYHYGSGGAGAGAIPYGSYPINIGKGDIGPIGQSIGSAATIGGLGGEVHGPGHTFEGLQIHRAFSDQLDHLYTQGCFSVSASEWPTFKRKLMEENRLHPEGLNLNIDRSGMASITPRGSTQELVPRHAADPAKGRQEISSSIAKSPDENRRVLDARANLEHTVTGKATLTANINAPVGTKVAVAADGLFKRTEVNRQTQMTPASVGPSIAGGS
jgi:hypothetical protein